LLLSARDEAGEAMTDVELHDELMTLLLAGHETTATAIAWALYWVHKLPNIREQILQELETLGDNPEPLNIARLPYLTAVCNETLRIYPVAVLTVPRAVKEPVELMGYPLEPGTRLYGCIYLTHHREDIYPNSQQFKPERFLERQFSPYEFLPFGGGIRRCIGEALALFEMKLVLATILQRYELALADQRPERPKRRGVTFAPERGVKMVMRSASLSPSFATLKV
jgi:cytochrome P450